jgi:uncharacterized protein with GYD domain
MPKYMIQVSYTPAAMATFVSNPQDRVPGVHALFEKAGGTLHNMDYCFGEYDIVLMGSLPDDTAMAALSLVVTAQGHVRSLHTTRLISPEDFMAAQHKAHGLSYKAPTKG